MFELGVWPSTSGRAEVITHRFFGPKLISTTQVIESQFLKSAWCRLDSLGAVLDDLWRRLLLALHNW